MTLFINIFPVFSASILFKAIEVPISFNSFKSKFIDGYINNLITLALENWMQYFPLVSFWPLKARRTALISTPDSFHHEKLIPGPEIQLHRAVFLSNTHIKNEWNTTVTISWCRQSPHSSSYPNHISSNPFCMTCSQNSPTHTIPPFLPLVQTHNPGLIYCNHPLTPISSPLNEL